MQGSNIVDIENIKIEKNAYYLFVRLDFNLTFPVEFVGKKDLISSPGSRKIPYHTKKIKGKIVFERKDFIKTLSKDS